MSKQPTRTRAEFEAELAKLHEGESKQDRAKRLARNKRVRERRKKQRAAKRKLRRKTRRVAQVTAVTGPIFMITRAEDAIACYLNGRHVCTMSELENHHEELQRVLEFIGEAFGATVQHHDLRVQN